MEQRRALHFDRLAKPRSRSRRARRITLALILAVVTVGSVIIFTYRDRVSDLVQMVETKYLQHQQQ